MTESRYVKLVSAEQTEFFISEPVAFLSKELRERFSAAAGSPAELRLNVSSDALMVVLEYLHALRALEEEGAAPAFDFPAEKALEVLSAALLLKI